MSNNTENTRTEMTFEKENMTAIQKAVYVGENNGTSIPMSIADTINTGNDELNKLTVSLMTCDAMNDRIKAYKAVTLSYIKKNFARLGGKTGCRDIIEYGKKFLNYERAQINFLIQLSEKYIAIDETMKSETVPALTDFKYNIIKDCDGYTMKIGQLQEIISVDKEKVLEALASGTIDATSTQKELRAWKKAVNNTIDTTATENADNADNTDNADNADNADTSEKPMSDKERLSAILNIISGLQNEEVSEALTKAVEKAEKILAKA